MAKATFWEDPIAWTVQLFDTNVYGPKAPASGSDNVFNPALLQAKRPRSLSYKKHAYTPDTPIKSLASDASFWLANHWPREVQKEGFTAFLAYRIAEIMSGDLDTKFWRSLSLHSIQNMKSVPSCVPATIQPPAKFATPGSLNSDCTYADSSATSDPCGNAGHTDDSGYFVDDYSIHENRIFTVPASAVVNDPRPAFASQQCTIDALYQHKNRNAFTNLFKASWAQADSGFSLADKALDANGRYYYYAYSIPSSDPVTGYATMMRKFVVDCRYKSQDDGFSDNTDGFLLIQNGPGNPRGRYRYMNTETLCSQVNTMAAYIARTEDEQDMEPGPGGFIFLFSIGFDISPVRIAYNPSTGEETWQLWAEQTPTLDLSFWANLRSMWNKGFPDSPCPYLPSILTKYMGHQTPTTPYDWASYQGIAAQYPLGHDGRQLIDQKTFIPPGGDGYTYCRTAFNWNGHTSGNGLAGYFGANGWQQLPPARSPAHLDNWNSVDSYHFSSGWGWHIVCYRSGSYTQYYWQPGDPAPHLPAMP
jgi:hypothetical protein